MTSFKIFILTFSLSPNNGVEDDGDGDVDDRVDDNGGNINGLHNGRLPDAGARRREGAPGSKCQHICHFLYSIFIKENIVNQQWYSF